MAYETQLIHRYNDIHKRLIGKPEPEPIEPPPPIAPMRRPEPETLIHIQVPSIAYIVRMVADNETDVTVIELLSPRRDLHLCNARKIVYHLARKFTMLSTPVIGRHLGGRDHTTILHGCKRLAQERLKDEKLDRKVLAYELLLDSSR